MTSIFVSMAIHFDQVLAIASVFSKWNLRNPSYAFTILHTFDIAKIVKTLRFHQEKSNNWTTCAT